MSYSTQVSQLLLSKIRTDGGTQLRACTCQETVDDYATALQAGARFPPVIVFRDLASIYWLASGFHRLAAHQQVGRKTIDADVRAGELRDAILFAAGENRKHGLRRTNQDKRRAALALLLDPEWSKWPGRQIADHCGVSEALVRLLRLELATPPPEPETASSVSSQECAHRAHTLAKTPNQSDTTEDEEESDQSTAIHRAIDHLEIALQALRGVEEVDKPRGWIERARDLLRDRS